MFANLSVVASVQSHSVLPEVLEEGWQDFCFNVIGFHTISATTLLHHLQGGEKKKSPNNKQSLLPITGFEITLLIYVIHGSYLQNNLLHLFIRGLELSDEDEHHLSGVVVCILSIH